MRLLRLLLLSIVTFAAPQPSTDEQAQKIANAITETKAKDYSEELRELRKEIAKQHEKDWWDLAAVIASGTGIFLIGWTGWLTHKMREAAHRQAESADTQAKASHEQTIAAKHMLEVARQQTSLDSRPLIVPKGDSNGHPYIEFHETDTMFEFPISNIGRGPAFNIELFEDLSVKSHDLLNGMAFLRQDNTSTLSIMLESLNCVSNCTTVGEVLHQLIRDDSAIPLRVEYKDILGTIWYSKFLIYATGREGELICDFDHSERSPTSTIQQ